MQGKLQKICLNNNEDNGGIFANRETHTTVRNTRTYTIIILAPYFYLISAGVGAYQRASRHKIARMAGTAASTLGCHNMILLLVLLLMSMNSGDARKGKSGEKGENSVFEENVLFSTQRMKERPEFLPILQNNRALNQIILPLCLTKESAAYNEIHHEMQHLVVEEEECFLIELAKSGWVTFIPSPPPRAIVLHKYIMYSRVRSDF